MLMTIDAKLSVRRANSHDAELLSELGARTFRETFAADNSDEDMAAYLATSFNPTQQAAELADPNASFQIAEIDALAVGYALLRTGEAPIEVTSNHPLELVRL